MSGKMSVLHLGDQRRVENRPVIGLDHNPQDHLINSFSRLWNKHFAEQGSKFVDAFGTRNQNVAGYKNCDQWWKIYESVVWCD